MQQLLIYFFIALGLSVDAFSLSIAYGTMQITKKSIFVIATSVGLFHFFMPILGSLIGNVIKHIIPVPNKLVGIILLIVVGQMFFDKNEENKSPLNSIIAILGFSFSVSLDSFSIGIGLGTLTNNIIIPSIIFAIISGLITLIGLLLGKRLYNKLGNKAIIIGIIILTIIAIKYLF